MNSNTWMDVWNRRALSIQEVSVLQSLVFLDGFDSGAGKIHEDDWSDYIQYISRAIDIRKNESIFEVGCGSGAFLYLFYINGHTVGGNDYSIPLIQKAQSVFNQMEFSLSEAIKIETDTRYDIVLSNGVYHYFPDLNYAEQVSLKMLKKAKRAIAILEVPDAALKNESEETRRGMLPPEEYDKKYKGLQHLYYRKDWFEKFALRNDCTCRIFNQNINSYGNNRFRFNCIIEKKI